MGVPEDTMGVPEVAMVDLGMTKSATGGVELVLRLHQEWISPWMSW